jgi:regulator of sigma E protease
MSIIIFILILLVLVVSHEFGHFIVAKKSGIRVDEFSFGFPPKLFGKKFGETTYNFNLLPLGGYVKIFGENPDEDSINGPDSKRSFVNKPWYVQAGVLIAGVTMNFLVAWLLLSIGFMSGLPSSTSNIPNGSIAENQSLTITSVGVNSPAEKAGIKVGDKIVSLETGKDSTKLLSSNLGTESIQNFIKSHSGEEIKMSILRGKEQIEVNVIPEVSKEGTPMVGISMDMIGILKLPVHQAVWEGLKLSGNIFAGTVVGFYHLISSAIVGQADMSTLTGPVGIVGVVGDAAKFGFYLLIIFYGF